MCIGLLPPLLLEPASGRVSAYTSASLLEIRCYRHTAVRVALLLWPARYQVDINFGTYLGCLLVPPFVLLLCRRGGVWKANVVSAVWPRSTLCVDVRYCSTACSVPGVDTHRSAAVVSRGNTFSTANSTKTAGRRAGSRSTTRLMTEQRSKGLVYGPGTINSTRTNKYYILVYCRVVKILEPQGLILKRDLGRTLPRARMMFELHLL